MQWQRETINNLIEEAIMEADQKGIKVLSLGLLNQASNILFIYLAGNCPCRTVFIFNSRK